MQSINFCAHVALYKHSDKASCLPFNPLDSSFKMLSLSGIYDTFLIILLILIYVRVPIIQASMTQYLD